MADNQEYLDQLLQKIEILSKKQERFYREILELKQEINDLKVSGVQKEKQITEDSAAVSAVEPLEKIPEKVPEEVAKPVQPIAQKQETPPISKPLAKKIVKPKGKSNIEKFIGENLISKIGIIILIIGVAIGAKYSIDNDLISPLTRIILGYLTGIGLIVVGMKLKKKYEGFSAVLVSGAIAILYFITFLAYSLYGLMPQLVAFALMLIFTVFTVFTAIQYNKQVIAHIGLVGAYAVPFLLSEGSGRVGVLFGYMSIINIGILVISLQRYWKSLYYSSFILSWLIYFAWYTTDYAMDIHFRLAIVFLGLFFAIFYGIFLMYKLRKREKFGSGDVILQLINAFMFYGLGISILNSHPIGEQLLGVFTLANAVIHFVISVFIYRLKLADRNLFYFTSGMVLVFISIAFPVQLDGNWVTLLWTAEAALLFWIGRTRKVPIYEKLAYPVIAVAFFSLMHDWWTYYAAYYEYGIEESVSSIVPFFNITVLTSLACAASFGYILYVHRSDTYPFQWPKQKTLYQLISLWISAMFLFIIYVVFFLEIIQYWDGLEEDKQGFMGVWLINYTLFFLTVLSIANMIKFKNIVLGYITMMMNLFVLFIFITGGLIMLSELRESYLQPELLVSGEASIYYIVIRYISLAFCASLLIAFYYYVRQDFLKSTYKMAYDVIMQIVIICIISSELVHWLDMAGYASSDKLGLSILWGIYALLLIVFGFWKKRKHIRIIAFVLFGITLLKLFLYDIADLSTISKTIVFVSLGVLLLIISFLYNKYKHIITDEIKE